MQDEAAHNDGWRVGEIILLGRKIPALKLDVSIQFIPGFDDPDSLKPGKRDCAPAAKRGLRFIDR